MPGKLMQLRRYKTGVSVSNKRSIKLSYHLACPYDSIMYAQPRGRRIALPTHVKGFFDDL
jgi:hypothetical protein